ncbi:hypothetical protein GCM10027321_25640 [Massilia terrae]|uniref:PP0621 family protein n=1 Tax=Massilia terrae TaxID=1811224 RepID=A0ABT2CXP5_9BURK|nr:PP0621 family protein [Massilia terrae]MCS0658570.1 PP0621 family protein [Massilia terrae]
MTRLLFWIGFIVLVVMALRSKFREAAPRPPARRAPGPAPAAQAEAESMACCAHCGMYFPASEAVRADGRDFCSPAHARLPSH